MLPSPHGQVARNWGTLSLSSFPPPSRPDGFPLLHVALSQNIPPTGIRNCYSLKKNISLTLLETSKAVGSVSTL